MTHTAVTEGNLPHNTLYIPFPVLTALVEKEWVPWHLAQQIEHQQCYTFGTVSINTVLPLACEAPV